MRFTLRLSLTAAALAAPLLVHGAVATVAGIDVASLLQKQHIPEQIAQLKAVAADPSGKNVALLFLDSKGNYRIYKNGTRLLGGTVSSVADFAPVMFSMTDDGKLLSAVQPTSLFLDARAILRNEFDFHVGSNSVSYANGILTYASNENIIEFNSKTASRTILYRHPGYKMLFVRRSGSSIVYAAEDARGNYSLFKNGALYSRFPVSNPWNYLVTAQGDVFYFSLQADGYVLYKNNQEYFRHSGQGGFLFENAENGDVWHVSYESVSGGAVSVHLFRNQGKNDYFPKNIGNAEGMIAFGNGSYAIRVGVPDLQNFRIFKDGKIIGGSFSFGGNLSDFHGPFIANGTVYTRDYRNGHWQLDEDGVPLDVGLKDVWLLTVNAGKVTAYGTR